MTPIEQLLAAIDDRGPSPQTHGSIMARHEREWPTLWAAIRRIRSEEAPRDALRRRESVPGETAAYVAFLEEERTRHLIAMSAAVEKIHEIYEATPRMSTAGLAVDALDFLNPHIPEHAQRRPH